MVAKIYPNDHLPPRAHVFGADWEVRVLLGESATFWDVACGNPNSKQIAAAVTLVASSLAAGNAMWEEIHGGKRHE